MYKTEEMRRHLNIVSYLFMIMSIVPAVTMFLFYLLIFGGMTALSVTNNDTAPLLIISGGLGLILIIILAIATVPGFLAGYGLLKNKEWGRVLGIVMAVIYLLAFPLGTAFGIYALWVLLNEETEYNLKGVVNGA